MARPISFQLPPRDPRPQLRDKVEQAPIEHAEALLDAYELLQQLHDHGVLDLLRGALGAGDKLVEAAVGAASSAESVRAIRNTVILARMLGSVNPDVLQAIANAVGETLGSQRKPVIEPPGLFSLLGDFRQEELRRSVSLINRFLRALGEQLKAQGESQGKP